MNYNIETFKTVTHVVVVWCRNRMNYNHTSKNTTFQDVVVWCRNRMNYNLRSDPDRYFEVVVWCRNRMNYNVSASVEDLVVLWFDVEIEWITTFLRGTVSPGRLWFDVEIEWITTPIAFCRRCKCGTSLVGIKPLRGFFPSSAGHHRIISKMRSYWVWAAICCIVIGRSGTRLSLTRFRQNKFRLHPSHRYRVGSLLTYSEIWWLHRRYLEGHWSLFDEWAYIEGQSPIWTYM